MIRGRFLAGIAVSLLFVFPFYAGAVVINSGTKAQNVSYVMGFQPFHSNETPYLGQLKLNFNKGIISGTYTDLSVHPGSPFANARDLSVSGELRGTRITLVIRQITFRGTLNGEMMMSGNAMIRDEIYRFNAHQGSPGSRR
ncbi:MAG TPA: hypothetical protein VGI19_11890 [Candidatus Cybelea sp.]|jgi:hypothetical protein